MKKRTIDFLIVIFAMLLIVINVLAIEWPAPPPSPDVSGLTGATPTPSPTPTTSFPAPPTAPGVPIATATPTPVEGPPPFSPPAPGTQPTATPTPAPTATPQPITAFPSPPTAPSIPIITTPTPTPTLPPAIGFPTPPTTPGVPGAAPTPTERERIIERIIEKQIPGPEKIIEKVVAPSEDDDVKDILKAIMRDRRGTAGIPMPELQQPAPMAGAPNLEHLEIMGKIDRLETRIESIREFIKNTIAQEIIGVKSAITDNNNNINSIKNSIETLREEILSVPQKIEFPAPPDITPIRRITLSSLITIILSALLIIAILVLFVIKIFKQEEANIEELKFYFKTELGQGTEETYLKDEARKIDWNEKEINKAMGQAKEEMEKEQTEQQEIPQLPEGMPEGMY